MFDLLSLVVVLYGQVDGYPTLFLYKDDVKIGEYDGERTLDEMHEFVVKQWSGPEKDEL